MDPLLVIEAGFTETSMRGSLDQDPNASTDSHIMKALPAFKGREAVRCLRPGKVTAASNMSWLHHASPRNHAINTQSLRGCLLQGAALCTGCAYKPVHQATDQNFQSKEKHGCPDTNSRPAFGVSTTFAASLGAPCRCATPEPSARLSAPWWPA